MNTLTLIRFVAKPFVFLVCLIPLLHAAGDIYGITGTLGANPTENLQDRFGVWGLRFLLIALAVTPLRKLTRRNWLARFRRMLGLFAFFYVFLHFIVWLLLDREIASNPAWSYVFEDILERPFITIGFISLLILLALAATSAEAIRRRLGRSWQKLHYGIYAAAILGVWHYWWQVKLDASDPAIYATILAVLLGYRIWTRKHTPT
ncbi:MAG: sulfoxide reductase heme-binding subunit YedZ [Woeseiaceae bacterium]|nr:sulfoxide reductase heme-binding subunit YedZ [Woeseiaceae bacterium]